MYFVELKILSGSSLLEYHTNDTQYKHTHVLFSVVHISTIPVDVNVDEKNGFVKSTAVSHHVNTVIDT